MEPESTRDTIRIPTCKQRRRDPNQVREDRHSDSQNKGSGIHEQNQKSPGSPADQRVAMEMIGVAEQTEENQLRCCVCIQAASNQEVTDGDPVRGLRPYGRETREAGARYAITQIPVSDDSKNCIEGGGESLQRVSGLHGVSRIAHFGDEDEEHEMARVCEDGIGDGDEGVDERGLEEYAGGAALEGVDSGSDHADDAGDED